MAAPRPMPLQPGRIPDERTVLIPLNNQYSQVQRGDVRATLRLVGTAGSGLVADGYGLGVTNIALAILGHLYPAQMTAVDKGLVVSVALVGVIFGQLSFGSVADICGRKVAAISTSILMIVGTAASAMVTDSPWCGLALQLTLARAMLGFGIGGEYPLSAAIAKEASDGQPLCLSRSQLLVVNMLCFNLGILMQFLLVLGLIAVNMPLEHVWRVVLFCGVAPAFLALWLRLGMQEPKAAATESVPEASIGGFSGYFKNLKAAAGPRWPVLVGACLSWMLFNFVSYSQNSFSAVVYDRTFGDVQDSAAEMVRKDAVFGLFTTLASIAGSVVGFFVEARLSRRDMQFMGFSVITCLLIGASWLFGRTDGAVLMHAFYIIYCLLGFSMSFIGITSYLVPSESFPAAVRGTCVGFAAASGKVGAAIGSALFPAAEEALGLSAVLFFSGVVMLVGCVITVLFTPHHGDIPLSPEAGRKEP